MCLRGLGGHAPAASGGPRDPVVGAQQLEEFVGSHRTAEEIALQLVAAFLYQPGALRLVSTPSAITSR